MTNAPAKMYVRAPDVPDREASAADRAGLPKDRLGVPIHYHWRAMIEPIAYHHPAKGRLTFSQSDLSAADRYTKEMIADGSRPYLPVGHGGKNDNQGFIYRTNYDGKYLWGLQGFIGDSARDTAAKYETSVCLERNWKGGNGKVYPIVVTHNALVPDPVAMALPDYMALSRDASGGPGEAVPIFTPAAEGKSPMTPEQLAMARDILGETEEPVTEENALDLVFQMARTARTLYDEVEEKKVELSRAAEQLEAQRVEMARGVAPVVDAEALTDRADSYVSRIELAAERGDLPKFMADRMKGVVRPKGKPSAYMLSRSEEFDARPIDAILDLFKDSGLAKKIAPRGEVTGRQELIELARSVPGGDDNKKDRQTELLMEQLGKK